MGDVIADPKPQHGWAAARKKQCQDWRSGAFFDGHG